jgi:hypothetical protein
LYEAAQNFEVFSKIFKTKLFLNQKPIVVDDFSRPIQWYHSQANPIWPDGTFNIILTDYTFWIKPSRVLETVDT